MNAAEQKLEPIRLAVTVPLPQDRAFALFTENIHTWWPLDLHAVSGDQVETCFMDRFPGGTMAERSKSGEEFVWADILIFEPPRRFVVSWHPKDTPATELEITFTPADPGTLVEIEHRGWEVFKDLAKEARAEYQGGWAPVIERYVAAAQAPAKK